MVDIDAEAGKKTRGQSRHHHHRLVKAIHAAWKGKKEKKEGEAIDCKSVKPWKGTS